MVARSEDDLRQMIVRGLTQPDAGSAARKRFVADFFGSTADGRLRATCCGLSAEPRHPMSLSRISVVTPTLRRPKGSGGVARQSCSSKLAAL